MYGNECSFGAQNSKKMAGMLRVIAWQCSSLRILRILYKTIIKNIYFFNNIIFATSKCIYFHLNVIYSIIFVLGSIRYRMPFILRLDIASSWYSIMLSRDAQLTSSVGKGKKIRPSAQALGRSWTGRKV